MAMEFYLSKHRCKQCHGELFFNWKQNVYSDLNKITGQIHNHLENYVFLPIITIHKSQFLFKSPICHSCNKNIRRKRMIIKNNYAERVNRGSEILNFKCLNCGNTYNILGTLQIELLKK